MKSNYLFATLLAGCMLFATASFAGGIPRYGLAGGGIHGGVGNTAKAGLDTINLMSTHDDPTNGPGEPLYYGDFEDAWGNNSDWNGWTSQDLTAKTVTHWNVSNYNQSDQGNHAAWCGDMGFPSCGGADPAGGYGNNWDEIIEFRRTVPDPGTGSTVTVTATLIHDSEPGYDYTHLSYQYQGQAFADMQSWDGTGTETVANSVTYQVQDYVDGTDIVISFRFQSDGAYSDEDCSYPSAGGCQVDDINVHLVNGAFTEDHFEDFEHGGVADDFGIWNTAFPTSVGDFARIWMGLEDYDPCVSNYTSQVAFIDDGVVVPGTGGSMCINWCYGPGGYIVTTTGGLAGPDNHIFNAAVSPVMAWPAPQGGTGPDEDGISLAFGVYQHEDLSADAPGIFYGWGVRSADTDGSAGNGVQDISTQPWRSREFYIFGGNPGYNRPVQDISDLMNPGRDEVQVRLTVQELGYVWGWNGNDGYPAPYFDNVTVKIFPQIGPGMYVRELGLAQDGFPASRVIDYENLGANSVRFDMAANISPASHLRNDPGDSVVVDIASVRAGASLDGDPLLHYIVERNSLFDPYRTSGLDAVGTVAGQPAVGADGPVADKWAFDLPDTGFLFPGDVLHYYISATDAIGGVGGTDPRTALIPADTTGFSNGIDNDFGDPLGYDPSFTVRALPSIRQDSNGDFVQPIALFINDFANRDQADTWYHALDNIDAQTSVVMDDVYDLYYVNGPSSGVGNGIGGRADSGTLAGYSDILYTCGNLGVNTIANGDFGNDPGDDVGVLTDWMDLGGRDMFLTGDDLASDLAQSGSRTLAFLNDYLGVSLVTSYIRPLIHNQVAPLVRVMPGNPVFSSILETWVAYGGCSGINTFDAVEPFGAGQRLAEFLDPSGQSGQYSYSAATLNIRNPGPTQSRAVSMPVDLMYVYTDSGSQLNILSARDQLLYDVLLYFQVIPGPIGGVETDVPSLAFGVDNFPNPFNPSTTINFSLPRAGHFKLTIYNVRGQLVKTLIDGDRPAGENQTIVWDGTDNLGSAAASGIYFYEARLENQVKYGKMALLK